jgi:hypothetical protein
MCVCVVDRCTKRNRGMGLTGNIHLTGPHDTSFIIITPPSGIPARLVSKLQRSSTFSQDNVSPYGIKYMRWMVSFQVPCRVHAQV